MRRELNDMLELHYFRMVMHIDPEDYFLTRSGSLSTTLHGEKNSILMHLPLLWSQFPKFSNEA